MDKTCIKIIASMIRVSPFEDRRNLLSNIDKVKLDTLKGKRLFKFFLSCYPENCVFHSKQ